MSLAPILQYNQANCSDFEADIYGVEVVADFFALWPIQHDYGSNAMRL